jgi:hypothetical protein
MMVAIAALLFWSSEVGAGSQFAICSGRLTKPLRAPACWRIYSGANIVVLAGIIKFMFGKRA